MRLTSRPRPSALDESRAISEVTIPSNGEDKWLFDYKLDLVFTDNSHMTRP
jgi:hypothetical protein